MAVGISSSCFFPMNTEDAFLTLAQNGVKTIEVFFNARCEASGEVLRSIADVRREYQIRISAIHPYSSFVEPNTIFGNYHRRYLDGLAMYRELCEAAHVLDCDMLILHGDKSPFHCSTEDYIERYRALAKMTKGEGIRLTQENVVHFQSSYPPFLRLLRDAVGEDFFMTLDIKQAVRSGLDPIQLAEEFADRIVHVHISDHGEKGNCLLPGQGDFDFAKLHNTLCASGFQGDYIVEVYQWAFETADDLLQSYKSVEELLS